MRNTPLSDSTSSTQLRAAYEMGDRLPSSRGDGDSKGNESAPVEAAAQGVDEYPKGATLVFVVLALVLSVFLSSLDIVCEPRPPLQV